MQDNSPRTTGSNWVWFHRFGSPEYFYRFASRWAPICAWISLALMLVGAYLGLVVAPPDYQMGDSYRIIYLHVPSAWMSMFTYTMMAVSAGIGLIWKLKLAHMVAISIAPLGAAFTFLALVTGSLWGKPTWGTYWIWDARLTSELVLLFLFLGYLALVSSIENRRTAYQAGAVLALVGIVNVPIIHFSVEWWNTLHQGATITKFDKPSMDTSMLVPLLIMFVAVNFYFAASLFNRVRCELLVQESNTSWVKKLGRPG